MRVKAGGLADGTVILRAVCFSAKSVGFGRGAAAEESGVALWRKGGCGEGNVRGEGAALDDLGRAEERLCVDDCGRCNLPRSAPCVELRIRERGRRTTH